MPVCMSVFLYVFLSCLLACCRSRSSGTGLLSFFRQGSDVGVKGLFSLSLSLLLDCLHGVFFFPLALLASLTTGEVC